MRDLVAKAIFLIWLIVSPTVVAESALTPVSTSSGPLVAVAELQRQKSFGFLDVDGSGNARLVETTTSGEMKEVDSDPGAGGDTSSAEHQISLKDSRPRRATNYHLKASIFTLMVAAIWSPMATSMIPEIMDRPSLLWVRIILYLCYLLECLLSSTRRYLSNSLGPAGMNEYIQQLQEAPPTILWEIECYHYRHVWRKQGNDRTTHSREKVITHRARHAFAMESWKDVTSLETLDRAIAIGDSSEAFTSSSSSTSTFLKTSLAKLFIFANPAVGNNYFSQETLFKEREGQYDRHYDFKRSILLKGFRHKVLVVRTGLSDIAFASPLWFWVASCVGMTVPYRIWFTNHCQQTELTIAKEIYG